MTLRILGAFLCVLLLAGCGSGGAPSATLGGTPSPTSSAAPTATEGARVYPYTLPWPAAELEREWQYADLAWDGEARIDHGNKYTDATRTQDGDLFAFGYQTTGTAADLQALVARQAAESHGCELDPREEQPLAGGGEDGVLAVHDCGGQTVIRWFGVHEGFGLAVALIVGSEADAEVARSHFEARIGELVWGD